MFYVYVTGTGTVEAFRSQLMDSSPDMLWRSIIMRHHTDLEVSIQYICFLALKVIVAARSPVFAAMFSSWMTEAQTRKTVRREQIGRILRPFSASGSCSNR